MPPIIALVFCLCMVVVLLRVERARNPHTSPALWVPTLWTLIYASRPIGRWFQYAPLGGGTSNEAGSPIDQLVLTILLISALFILFKRSANWPNFIQNNTWLVILYTYAGLSILWTDLPLVSLRRWIKSAGDILMALVILSEHRPLQALESLFRRCAYVLIPFSLILMKYYPHLGVAYGRWSGLQMWTGVTLHKNSLGQLCTLSAFLLIWALLQGWQAGILRENRAQTLADILVLSISLFLLRGPEGAFSATSVAVFILSTLVLLVFHRRQDYARSVATHLKMIMVGLILAWWLFSQTLLPVVSSSLGRDETLTGRTEYWDVLLTLASQNPLLGLGYGGFYGLEEVGDSLSQAHNGYLAVYVELGAAGMLLLAAFLLSLCGKIQNVMEYSVAWATYGICVLLISLLFNYSEACFFQSGNFVWTYMVLVAVVFSTSPDTGVLK